MSIDLKKILEEKGSIQKFVGVVPEGFVLVHENTLEQLKEFDTWKDWKNGLIDIKNLNKLNFEDT